VFPEFRHGRHALPSSQVHVRRSIGYRSKSIMYTEGRSDQGGQTHVHIAAFAFFVTVELTMLGFALAALEVAPAGTQRH